MQALHFMLHVETIFTFFNIDQGRSYKLVIKIAV